MVFDIIHLKQIFNHKNLELQKSEAEIKNLFNKLFYLGGFVGSVILLPQLIRVWIYQDVRGLALLTWMGFLAGSMFWLMYGIFNKVKPLILAYSVSTIIHLFIVIGIMLFRQNTL